MELQTIRREPKPKKIRVVNDLEERLARARGVYFTNYKGLTVAEMTELRRHCRQNRVEYLVCKNTMARRALQGKGYDEALRCLEGPTGIAFGYDDPAVPAKVLSEFAAKNEKLVLKGGVFEGKVVTAGDIRVIRDLPSREVALAQVVGTLFAPVQGFYQVISAVLRDFVFVLDRIAEKKRGPEEGNSQQR